MSIPGDSGYPPRGVNLAENQTPEMLGAAITLMVIGTLAVLLRIYIRVKTSQTNFGLDDLLIFAALFFAYGSGICVIISVQYKNGWHQQSLTDSEFIALWKLLFAHMFIYSTTVTLTKSSIMMFYRRIFNLHRSLYFAMAIILGYFFAVVITIAVACRPVSYFWHQYTDPMVEGKCIDVPEFFFINGIAAVLIDVMILCVPAPVIWKLQMPKTQRVAVTSILLLGSFVCVAGIVRVVFLHKHIRSNDPSWTIAPVFVWSCVEPFIGILCACLPTFSPLFRRWWTALGIKRSATKKKDGYYETGGSQIHGSKDSMSEDQENESQGDEVQLTSFPGWPLNFWRGKNSRDDVRSSNSRIQIKEDITVSWT
ncbi:hypothetical protein N7457_005297 [Penicillium paradoxum]|uniref:uncharacterized protein n=1 Tax=Penicillium paradoxum TaxID=176176 RepID=UPI002548DCCE|nr:uncharacterized protein N7457_005297 [Penicillium paradoxum]KAJ5780137.1 hypothetical protein N7457_005297 [Penicillium paradoxum]